MPKDRDPLKVYSRRLFESLPNDPAREARSLGRVTIETTWGDVLSKVIEELDLEVDKALQILGIDITDVGNGQRVSFDNKQYSYYADDRIYTIRDKLQDMLEPELERLVTRVDEIAEQWLSTPEQTDKYRRQASELRGFLEAFEDINYTLRSHIRYHEPRTPLRAESRLQVSRVDALYDELSGRVKILECCTHLTTLEQFLSALMQLDPDNPLYDVWIRAMSSTLQGIIDRRRNDIESRTPDTILVSEQEIEYLKRELRVNFYDYIHDLATERWRQIAEVAFLAENYHSKRIVQGAEV